MNPRREAQAGVTLMEVMIMGLITSALMILITQSIASLSSTRGEHRAQANIGRTTDQIARLIEGDITFSSRIFTESAEDRAYLNGLTIGRALAGAGHRLPLLTSRGYFDIDSTSTPETGNVLFLGVRGDRHRVVLSRTDPNDACLVQSHRWIVYHTETSPKGILDLRRWVSQQLASYWDIEGITNSLRKEQVVRALHDAGYRFAWDPTQPRGSGLYQLTSAGSMQLASSSKLVDGTDDATASRPFGPRAMKIAGNGTLPGTKVPEFAVPAGAFPGGFEVKVDGQAVSRLVLFRLVVQSVLPHKRAVHGEVRRLISAEG